MEKEVKRKATQRLRESADMVEVQKGGKMQADEEERISALAMRRFNYYPCSRYVDSSRWQSRLCIAYQKLHCLTMSMLCVQV